MRNVEDLVELLLAEHRNAEKVLAGHGPFLRSEASGWKDNVLAVVSGGVAADARKWRSWVVLRGFLKVNSELDTLPASSFENTSLVWSFSQK